MDGNPGLGQVLLSRIGWSSDPSCSMPYNEHLQLHRGSWAGDRFDVRVLDDVIQSMKNEGGWTDISRTAAKDVYELYKDDFCLGDFQEERQESDEQ